MINYYFILLEELCSMMEQTTKSNSSKRSWKPLVLVIPLRLGISTINPAYVQGVKVNKEKLLFCLAFLMKA